MKSNCRIRLIVGAIVFGSILMSSEEASAVCNRAAGLGETTFFATHGCWEEYFLYHYKAFDTNAEDWEDRGFNDACNTDMEYTKHWNATVVLGYGINFGFGFSGRAFHSSFEYEEATLARDDFYHDDLRHQILDVSGSNFALFTPRTGLVDLIRGTCSIYNPNIPPPGSTNFTTPPAVPVQTGDPVFRAGALLHEGWHAWKQKNGISNAQNGGHRVIGGPGVPGLCPPNNQCDSFYVHPKSLYDALQLWLEKTGHGSSHSVFQVQMEFLCDLADQAENFVPFGTRQVAAVTANNMATTRFTNPPPFACGSPQLLAVPLLAPPPPPPACNGGQQCVPLVHDDCGNNPSLYCSDITGCCELRVQ